MKKLIIIKVCHRNLHPSINLAIHNSLHTHCIGYRETQRLETRHIHVHIQGQVRDLGDMQHSQLVSSTSSCALTRNRFNMVTFMNPTPSLSNTWKALRTSSWEGQGSFKLWQYWDTICCSCSSDIVWLTALSLIADTSSLLPSSRRPRDLEERDGGEEGSEGLRETERGRREGGREMKKVAL